MRKIKIARYARPIKVQGGEEVYTRYSRREYELRRDLFYEEAPGHLTSLSYDE
jgi:hypothetical protein